MRRRNLFPLALTGLLALAASSPAAAAPIALGGVDARSEYTYNAGTDVGVYTFADTLTGEAGTVTTADLGGFIGGRITLELLLDTTGFDPTTDNMLDAQFIGTGGNEIVIWDATQTTTLLSFDVDFVDTVQFGIANGSSITIGENTVGGVDVTSRLTVTGGTRAGDVGGIGSPAALKLTLNRPQPAVTLANFQGYWGTSLITVGNGYAPLSASNWDLLIIPEPGTLLLVGLGVAALAGVRRSRS